MCIRQCWCSGTVLVATILDLHHKYNFLIRNLKKKTFLGNTLLGLKELNLIVCAQCKSSPLKQEIGYALKRKQENNQTLICSIGMSSTDVLQQTFIQKAPEPKRYVDETVCVHHNIKKKTGACKTWLILILFVNLFFLKKFEFLPHEQVVQENVNMLLVWTVYRWWFRLWW